MTTHIDRGAELIERAYQSYFDRFMAITSRAARRFRDRDWHGGRADALARLDLYATTIDEAIESLQRALRGSVLDRRVWSGMQTAFSERIAHRSDAEIAETFFNSITRRTFTTIGVDPRIEFVEATFGRRPLAEPKTVFTRYRVFGNLHATVRALLSDCRVAEFEDLRASVETVTARIGALRHAPGAIDMLDTVFYRGKGAYLIGRLPGPAGDRPLVIALSNTPEGAVVDTVLLTEDETSILFSFAHSYFHVHLEDAHQLIQFLQSIMPRKPEAELFSAVGLHKHAKTVLYRDLLRHLRSTSDKFVPAPGIPGMVMSVFTMPSYDVVFKVIRDDFAPPKRTTREDVRRRYQMVHRHDRAGRLTDAYEFEHLEFARARFDDSILKDLLQTASHNVRLNGDLVAINHVYVERRMTPLDVFLRSADRGSAQDVVVEYGNAIRDLAATNIFPGDLLLKNFGVTRHHRVIFYDYDEICLLTDCNFREMPMALHLDDELSADPWFYVGPNDIFPEEFIKFLGLGTELSQVFVQQHRALLAPRIWQAFQRRHRRGEIPDVFPYRRNGWQRSPTPVPAPRSERSRPAAHGTT